MKKGTKCENAQNEEKLLSTEEFAAAAKISRAHVYRLIHDRTISVYKAAGGKYNYIPEREVRRYMTAVYVPSIAERENEKG